MRAELEPITPELIESITQRIVERFHPRRIILFGSQARGDTHRDSDIDLFVEMESPLKPPDRASAVAGIFGLRRWAMDVVVYTPAEVERWSGVIGTLLYSIEKEGRVLYEQA